MNNLALVNRNVMSFFAGRSFRRPHFGNVQRLFCLHRSSSWLVSAIRDCHTGESTVQRRTWYKEVPELLVPNEGNPMIYLMDCKSTMVLALLLLANHRYQIPGSNVSRRRRFHLPSLAAVAGNLEPSLPMDERPGPTGSLSWGHLSSNGNINNCTDNYRRLARCSLLSCRFFSTRWQTMETTGTLLWTTLTFSQILKIVPSNRKRPIQLDLRPQLLVQQLPLQNHLMVGPVKVMNECQSDWYWVTSYSHCGVRFWIWNLQLAN